MKLIVKRRDRSNLGDWMCDPSDYFDLGETHTVDIYYDAMPVEDAEMVIIGGGGMFFFDPTIHEILQRAKAKKIPVVGWGIGTHKDGQFDPHYGCDLRDFTLLGLRDNSLIPGLDPGRPKTMHAVPCPSCMHVAFDADRIKPTRPVVCWQHRDRDALTKLGFPWMSNATEDFGEALDFLADAETVITDSYHGWYWASLLGKDVVLYQTNNAKFHALPWFVRRATTPEELAKLLGQTVTLRPDMLANCRRRNIDFCVRVKEIA